MVTEDRLLKDRVTGGRGHLKTGSLEDQSLLEDGHWKTDFAEEQNHWRTGSLEDQLLLEDRVTGRQDFDGGQGHWKTRLSWRTGSMDSGACL